MACIVGLAPLLQVERGQRFPRRPIRHGALETSHPDLTPRSLASPCTSLRLSSPCPRRAASPLTFRRPYIARVSAVVFNLLVKFHILPSWGPSSDVEGGYAAAGPGGARAEAERRRCVDRSIFALTNRALALKALDNRMARHPAAAGESSSASPMPPVAGPAHPAAVATTSPKTDSVVFDAASET